MDRYYTGTWEANAFSSTDNRLFNQDQPTHTAFTVLPTINTDVAGTAGLVTCTVLDQGVTDVGRDSAGNIYLTGTVWYRRQVFGRQPVYDFPFFTHKLQDLALLEQNWSGPPFFIKINPQKDKVLFGAWVGYELKDDPGSGYLETDYGNSISVSPKGDVYLGVGYYSYPSVASSGDKNKHPAPKILKLKDWYDPQCNGTCNMVQTVEKYPVDNYQNPEWVVTFPASWGYFSPDIAIDEKRGKVHVLSVQDKASLAPNPPIQLPVTEDALEKVGASTSNVFARLNGHYMQLSQTGDLQYATILAPEVGELPRYSSIVGAMVLNPENGDAYAIRRTAGAPANLDIVTKSYRDYSTNQKVNVAESGLVLSEKGYSNNWDFDNWNAIRRTHIAVFHEPAVPNIINDFAAGKDTFCLGALIVQGTADGPLEGNIPAYKSGDGSDLSHNLPFLFKGGVRFNHPKPLAGAPAYQWQSSTNGGAWTNVTGGNKPALKPPLAGEPGVLKFRRLVTISGQTYVSNEIDAVITGSPLGMQLTGPSDPVYFCPGTSATLNIGITGVSGNISWQWYNGFTPLSSSVITPASGNNVSVASFTAAIATTATDPGFYRLVVTDVTSGCKKEIFVTVLPVSEKIYPSATINFCPGATPSAVLGATVVNPAFDYKFAGPGITNPSLTKPTVTQAGVYTLQVSLKGQNSFCVGGETTVTIANPVGPHDAALVALTDKGFCQDDAPATIGLSTPPASGYTYSWSPGLYLNAYNIPNPRFDPGAAASPTGLREVNYVFRATRESDGCVFESNFTVRDTTKGEVEFTTTDYVLGGCVPLKFDITPDVAVGRHFRWEVFSTTYPGGKAALLASPDFGFGTKGDTIGIRSNSDLFYPKGTYSIVLIFKSAFFPFPAVNCYASGLITLNIGCGGGAPPTCGYSTPFVGSAKGTCGGYNNEPIAGFMYENI